MNGFWYLLYVVIVVCYRAQTNLRIVRLRRINPRVPKSSQNISNPTEKVQVKLAVLGKTIHKIRKKSFNGIRNLLERIDEPERGIQNLRKRLEGKQLG